MTRPFIPDQEAINRLLAVRSLKQFITRSWKYIDPSPFKDNWHIDALCEHLEAVNKGQIRRLIINIPPRHMKSLSFSVAWPAWTWLQRKNVGPLSGPAIRWLFSSYAQTLSVRDSVKCRRLMESPFYQQLKITSHGTGEMQANPYGNWRMTDDQNTKLRFDNSAGGYRLATSVDGGLTGEGGDIICIDDPHNVVDVESDIERKNVLVWWDEAMSTRLNDPEKGAYVVVMQRVHERDLVGHILAREHKDWVHLCLPFRYSATHKYVWQKDPRISEGELLWTERLTEKTAVKLERSMGSYAVAGQLQQLPAPRGGGDFKRAWFKTVDALPQGEVFDKVRAWDLASTEASGGSDPDWTVGLKMMRSRATGAFFITHVRRFRGSAGEVETVLKDTAKMDGNTTPIGLAQDPGQAGKSQVHYLTTQLAGYVLETSPETGSKQTRARPYAIQAEAGNVFLVSGEWNELYLDEVEAFPNASHDDQVDASSRAFHMLVGDVAPPVVAVFGFESASPFDV